MTVLDFPSFPSLRHHDAICERVKMRVALTAAERSDWHAYVYGWRRVMLNNFEPTSAVDPRGEYFEPQRAAAAEAMFRRKYQPPKPRWSPPLNDPNPRFAAQWRELARLRRQIGQTHYADGTPTPEALAYVETACRFACENVAGWGERNRREMEPFLADAAE